jgi:Protein of unknown function (DUF1580)
MEEHISLADVAALLPTRRGKKVHVMTVRRWIKKGSRGVHLIARRIGGIWFTTLVDLEQFKRDCTPQNETPPTLSIRSPAEATKAIEAAMEKLRQRGFFGREDGRRRGRQIKARDANADSPAHEG